MSSDLAGWDAEQGHNRSQESVRANSDRRTHRCIPAEPLESLIHLMCVIGQKHKRKSHGCINHMQAAHGNQPWNTRCGLYVNRELLWLEIIIKSYLFCCFLTLILLSYYTFPITLKTLMKSCEGQPVITVFKDSMCELVFVSVLNILQHRHVH